MCGAIIVRSQLLQFCCFGHDIGVDDDDDNDGFDVCLCVLIFVTLQRGFDQVCHAVRRVARLPVTAGGPFCSV